MPRVAVDAHQPLSRSPAPLSLTSLPLPPPPPLSLRQLRASYLQGLMWCLAYYVKGCISWTWYFPYHYGPMLQVRPHSAPH